MSGTAPAASPLVTIVTTDIAGITRGRSVEASAFEGILERGVGWVPADISLTPFDPIADPNPWGSKGDLRLIPDPVARFQVSGSRAATPLDFVMGDIVELDGSPWSCCVRTQLKDTLRLFHEETGLSVIAAFEQEFQVLGEPWPAAPAFSLQALRRADPFGPEVLAALRSAGIEPETFIAEYGRDQFEVTTAPVLALRAADEAVAVREIVRETARLLGLRTSFAPKTAVAGAGNGVHVHLSFRDAEGRPAAFDPARPGRLSATAGAFAAGVLDHLPALVALTAPSVISYLRLKPHHWSSAWTWLGERDREATLRICPTVEIGGRDPGPQLNLEFRAADACASPHLVMTAILRAGLDGIIRGLTTPPIVDADPLTMSQAERARLGIAPLPDSLPAALAAFEADETARVWFDPVFLETYLGMKRAELKLVEGLGGEELIARYVTVY